MEDAVKKMESKMSAEAVRRARIKAEQDIMAIRLAQFHFVTKSRQFLQIFVIKSWQFSPCFLRRLAIY